ncbi:MAG: hydantoinase/oxoprolinase family protein [Gammaproteobacteria bacterium]|nr:hydantoinase/oxoprolinase family protein [Gammaproteobacteria bacterium]NIM73991.1 hydantoinase/oxoprolinase family protein [Gammaproteobacteria bacterium]NIN38872.1 hydantoinase/oxoprolinase family protein [Gammaproteobacteria bacterium]NIO25767.1 hydantoinase/oxoprolinase family protein [Gammaproteobacteria bacterium]NIO66397.1 hydantoinase/oxoprolinase family protein [Gammaproteobacteria bacterium]
MSSGWQVGVDIGGTFTDVVAFQPSSGEVVEAKVRSHPDDPVAGLLAALDAVGIAWEQIEDLMHGSTLVTNAIVEDRLARVALVATEGFADTLAIGRQNRRHLYRLDLEPKTPPQVPEQLRFEVSERLDVDGRVLKALEPESVERAVRDVAQAQVQAVAVALLHAYADGSHEAQIGARLRDAVPFVALSHRISPEAREYERTSTTALSAGVMPLAAGYLDRLEASRPRSSRLHLLHSAGAMASPEALREQPLGLAFSGPAAGVSAAGWVARELGIDNAISFDMGGTTTDVCLVVEGRAEIRSDRSLAGRPLRMPMVAVESIGAGGGSIARLDSGALRVGPESAGAVPGPACYGLGGEAPTVTDANMVLGYLDADRPVADLHLDADAAKRALAPMAAELGTDVAQLALGIVRVANAAMARALRRVTVERGIDGRACTLVAFGGAGPMHAVELARSFDIERVVVPRFSSAFSALGCVGAEMSYTQQRTVRMLNTDWQVDRLNALHGELCERLGGQLPEDDRHGAIVGEVAAIRYSGQSYAVEVSAPALEDPTQLGRQFRARHEQLYGFATDEPWELVSLRISLTAPRRARPDMARARDDGNAALAGRSTACWFDASGPRQTPLHARAALADGDRLEGPAIIEDAWSTVVLPPGAVLRVDACGHLHIDVGEAP